ncbi:3-isopropylmalate dehydratase small subunit [Aureliella helgolandensis]|uniref:3-isopropylmalate dehydratase small subunit n=1 Tax=Aureliella helgolandensis TaxID=2527968 RepID=A0A518G1E9_9BACT|nr:3-isopropylmalate dehydratase small subunit [Aureliella helgolandensis]QDV22425.1 3-isopropylmalate dehydratase small subunit [Aureliella helgolandensis]
MQPFTKLTGVVAPLERSNIDTDQIIPKQFLKRIERTGFGQFLFFDWRFKDDGSDNPDFELNQPAAKGAQILLVQRNFGCGSSREHAVWALEDYGLRVILAPSFADIFFNNCFKNGVLPIKLSESVIEELFAKAREHAPYQMTVDLETCTLSDEYGLSLEFEVQASRRHSLLNGLDDIAMTLEMEDKITAYEVAHGIASGA